MDYQSNIEKYNRFFAIQRASCTPVIEMIFAIENVKNLLFYAKNFKSYIKFMTRANFSHRNINICISTFEKDQINIFYLR